MFNFSFNGITMDESKLDRRDVVINTHLPVYITMSTIPSRMKNTLRIIKNLMEHVSGFEKLILNVPYRYNRWPDTKHIDVSHDITDGRFYINRCKDYGPLTKFLPVLEDNLVPQNAILIVCDDMCYQLDAFRDIAMVQDRKIYDSFSYYVYPYSPDDSKKVDVPQGADLISMYTNNVVGFPTWFQELKGKLGVKSYFETPCFFVDDQVIGWYMSYMHIPMKQVERRHRNIYIKDCEKGLQSDNLNSQQGKNKRENVMAGCYRDLTKAFPI
jgi:hypothetical protein